MIKRCVKFCLDYQLACLLSVFTWLISYSYDYVYYANRVDHLNQLYQIAYIIISQFAHIDSWHLYLNLGGIWCICYGFNPWIQARIGWIGFLGGVAGVTAWIFYQNIAWYAGLSGALHGCFVTYAMALCFHQSMVYQDISAQLKNRATTIGMMLLTGIFLKLLVEQVTSIHAMLGIDIFENSMAFPIAHTAHLAGAIGGLAAYLAMLSMKWRHHDAKQKV